MELETRFATKVIKKLGKPAKMRKPKDMPRRPLSAYNIFFKEERTKMIREASKGGAATTVGFEALAKTIGQRWKILREREANRYKDLAKADMERYRQQMELYHLAVAKRSDTSSPERHGSSGTSTINRYTLASLDDPDRSQEGDAALVVAENYVKKVARNLTQNQLSSALDKHSGENPMVPRNFELPGALTSPSYRQAALPSRQLKGEPNIPWIVGNRAFTPSSPMILRQVLLEEQKRQLIQRQNEVNRHHHAQLELYLRLKQFSATRHIEHHLMPFNHFENGLLSSSKLELQQLLQLQHSLDSERVVSARNRFP